MNVQIRDLHKKDIPHLAELLNRTWGINSLKKNRISKNFGYAYLYNHLSHSTFVAVAEKENKACGVVCMEEFKTKTQKENLKKLKYKLKALIYFIPFALIKENWSYIHGWKMFHKETLRQEKYLNGSYDAELRLIALSEDSRGLGLGKALLLSAEKNLASHKKKTYFLNTDTECNFKFYDTMGLKKIAASEMKIKDEPDIKWEIYLYARE